MYTITCPICGKRNQKEFRYGNEDVGPMPSHDTLTPEKYLENLYSNGNHAGVQKEWWCHRQGCGTWFKVERNTLTNLQVKMGEVK